MSDLFRARGAVGVLTTTGKSISLDCRIIIRLGLILRFVIVLYLIIKMQLINFILIK